MRASFTRLVLLAVLGHTVSFPPAAVARLWITTSGSWTNPSNWNNNFSPGIDDFTFIDLGEDASVFLNGNQTSRALAFGDFAPSHKWTVLPGVPANSTLTLDPSGDEPIINVVNQTTTLRVVVAGTEGLTKTGFGTFVLTQPNTYSGTTAVRSGTLALDFSVDRITADIIPSDSELRLGALTAAAAGGTIKLIGDPGASNSQTFSGTTLLFGENGFEVDQNDAANIDLFLGFFDRDVGSVAAFTLPTSGDINAVSATIPNIHGVLGAWATIGSGSNAAWAANDGAGNIVPYTSFTEITGAPVIANSPAANMRWSNSTGDAMLAAGTTDINTLLFTDSARRIIAIPAGGTLRLGMSGGILKTDTSAGEAASQLTIGAPGTFLTAGGGPHLVGELVLNANSSAPDQNGIVVHSTITNNGQAPVNVIKSGNASVLFTATNTYIDGSYVASGRLRTNATGGFGTGPVYVATGAQAYLDAGTHTNNFFISGRGFAEPTGGPSGGALRLGGDGANVTGNVTLLGDALISAGGATTSGAAISGQITGSASVEFSSASGGVLTLTNSRNNWTGNTVIGPGVLRIGGTGEVIPFNRRANLIIHGDLQSNVPSVLDLNGRSETVEGLSSTGDSSKTIVTNSAPGPATLRLFPDREFPANFGGVIQDGAGIVGIVKEESGVQILSGRNTYSGPTDVRSGVLRLGSSSALPPKTSLMLTGGFAALDLDGFNATVSALSGPGVIFSSSTVIPTTVTVDGGTNVFNGSIFNHAGTAPIGLTIPRGALTLAGINNTYTGPTTINGGTLNVTGALAPTGMVLVNAGGTLTGGATFSSELFGRIGNVIMQPGSTLRPHGTLKPSSLTVNGGEMQFFLDVAPADRVNVIGEANFNAPSTISVSPIREGTFTLLTADTLRGIPPTLNLPAGARATFALSFETLADQIRLIITGSPPKALTWTGAQGSEWDLNTTANWSEGAMSETFFNLDNARFGDGPVNRNIVLNTTVVPNSVIVDNSAGNDYSITGTGSIGDSSYTGTSLTKRGAGTLTLGGTTTYNASIGVENGLLRTTGSIAINGVATILAPAKLVVEGTASAVEITGTGTTEVGNDAIAATLTTDFIRQSSLSIAPGSVVKTIPGGGTSVLGILLISGPADAPAAKFDLNNNSAVIDYAGASPVATVRSQVLAGRGGAGLGKTWNGQGITSSAAAAAATTDPESRSIGYAENASLPLGPYTNFRGQPVDNTSVLMAYTRTGDANLDGVVNDDDVTIVGATYSPGVPQPQWALGDFDYNGFVDDDDITLLGAFYDPSASPLITAASAVAVSGTDVAAVPEPATLALLGIGLVLAVFAAARPRSFGRR